MIGRESIVLTRGTASTPGKRFPEIVRAYIEIVPTDGVKYEIDKHSGYLMVDRPQRSSSFCPTLYGFVPRTYCGDRVAAYTLVGSPPVSHGDGDPLDICVLTEPTHLAWRDPS